MEELDVSLIVKRSLTGVVTLVSRSFFIQGLNFVTFFILTIVLSPAIIGIYTLATSILGVLGYFSDIGLAAALVQKKEEVLEKDLSTTFYLQQLLIIIISVLAVIAGGFVQRFYRLNGEGLWLYYVLIFSFLISSLKTIPSILLERVLRFDKLVIPQVVEAIFFDCIAVTFALLGWGIKSFIIAIFARDIAGLIAIYIVRPWRPRFIFSFSSAKHLLSFGIPFQLNSVLALFKDYIFMLVLGRILPLSAIGYIGFAQKWANAPLRLIMDNIIRITFPSFARLQHDAKRLGLAVEKSLFVMSFFIFPACVAIIFLFPILLAIIPKYHKWEPAMLSLGFFAVGATFSSISTPLTNALNAIRKVWATLYLMIFWTASTWILTLLLIKSFGFNGFAIASTIIAGSVIFVVILAKRYIDFSIIKAIKSPTIATIIMGIFLYVIVGHVMKNIFGFILLCILGGLIYFVSMWLIARKELREDIASIRNNL